ncbi:MAG: NAD(P)-dependent oxidoreductase [Desulfobacteraceae bacterium]|nr:MAG: NAD(P)-dependent oxidoreductase [Desulfobacteraceae bacterium]
MKEAVLLTGANGFIGRHLHQALAETYRVVRVVRPRQAGGEEEDCIRADLSGPDVVEPLISSLPVKEYKAVVHLAAVLCRPGDWDNPACFELNNAITMNMVRIARALSCETFVNFSSLAVYPNETGLYDENSKVDMSGNTECLYGLSKFNSEILFRYLLRSAMKVVNLRVTQVFGPGMQEDRLLGILLKELREENRITLFGNGERVSNFLYVGDLVQAVLAVLRKPLAGTYNLGNEKNRSYLDLARDVLAAVGREDSRIVLQEKGIRAKVEIDTKRFEREFDYVCRRNAVSFLGE